MPIPIAAVLDTSIPRLMSSACTKNLVLYLSTERTQISITSGLADNIPLLTSPQRLVAIMNGHKFLHSGGLRQPGVNTQNHRPTAIVLADQATGASCCRALVACGVQILIVVAVFDDEATAPEGIRTVDEECQDNDTLCFVTVSESRALEQVVSKVHEYEPDWIFSVSWHRDLPPSFLAPEHPKLCCIRWGLGSSTDSLSKAILRGETAVTLALQRISAMQGIFGVDENEVPIFPDDTASDVLQKLVVAQQQLLCLGLPKLLTGKCQQVITDSTKLASWDCNEIEKEEEPVNGEIDWKSSADAIYNLHRALAPPYSSGVWTRICGRKIVIGRARLCRLTDDLMGGSRKVPGFHVSGDGIFGACGDGRRITISQLLENGQPLTPTKLKTLLQHHYDEAVAGLESPALHSRTIFITGVNGFIGHHLARRLLETTSDWIIYGIDTDTSRIAYLLTSNKYRERLHFKQGSIENNWTWVESCVRQCQVTMPLAAIATPATYVHAPLKIFELDFETNLRIIRLVAGADKRLIFPSTSEVYGMCRDAEFDPQRSELVCGPICKTRWIYSCVKQLLDRLIYSYGCSEHGLDYTIFRPFNWVGAGLDSTNGAEAGTARVTSTFLGNIMRGESLKLIDSGAQRRSFTDIDDGIDALMKILENEDGVASGKIYNIGSPENHCSVRELASLMVKEAHDVDGLAKQSERIELEECNGETFYGDGYQDMQWRMPNINLTMEDLHWKPKVSLEQTISRLMHAEMDGRGGLAV